MTAMLPMAGDRCWSRIGIAGDRSCPELATVTHCQSCPVFATGARELFEGPVPDDYLDWLTGTIAAAPTDVAVADRTVLVFRVAVEWFAIDARSVRTVAPRSTVRRMPHRRDPAFLGLIAVRGELIPCISLGTLLSLPAAPSAPVAGERRLVVDRKSTRLNSSH